MATAQQEPRPDDTTEFLSAHPLFGHLDADKVPAFAGKFRKRRVAAGAPVYSQGEPAANTYVIFSGHARAMRSLHPGSSIPIAQLRREDVFGERAILPNQRWGVSIVSVTDLTLLSVAGADLREALSQNAHLCTAFVDYALDRSFRVAERLCRERMQSVGGRVALTIRDMCDRGTISDEKDWSIPITQAELAELVGASRESTCRALASLSRTGAITQKRGMLLIHDFDLLTSNIW